MRINKLRARLLGGATLGLAGVIGTIGIEASAQAESVCVLESATSFACSDGSSAIANGTVSDGATLASGDVGPLQISSMGALDVLLNGDINATLAPTSQVYSVVAVTAGGPLNYQATGLSEGASGRLLNTFLRSDQSVYASTGTVVVTDGGHLSTGVYSEALNGDNTLIATETLVHGSWARGLWTDAFNGNNRTDTGIVTATGPYSRGVIARALPQQGYCSAPSETLSTVVNVTGDISADYVGISALTCGTSVINVGAGRTVAVTGNEGMAILNIAMSSADTNIDGSVMAATPGGIAVDVRDGPSTTHIGATGTMSGRFDGDDWLDRLIIDAGGVWTAAGTSDFRGFDDELVNSGTVNVEAATLANLETVTNEGVLSISGGSFALPDAVAFTNNGTIRVAPGETSITSAATLLNNGVIDLQNGSAGDVLTITNDYVAGSSAQLWLDVDGEVSDLFVVSGTSTGTTQIFTSAPAQVMAEGILVATIDPAIVGKMSISTPASAPQLAFTLGNSGPSRLISYNLEQKGYNLYLTATPNAVAYQPLVLGSVVTDLWNRSAEIPLTQAASFAQSENGAQQLRVWGRAFGGMASFGSAASTEVFGSSHVIDGRLEMDQRGGLIGVNFRPSGSLVNLGLFGGYQVAKAEQSALGGGVSAKGFSGGAYGHVGGNTGLHGSLLLKLDQNKLRLTNAAYHNAAGDPDSRSWGVSARGGFRWTGGPWNVGAGAGLTFVTTEFKDFAAEGIGYELGKSRSLRGQTGARIGHAGKWAPFVDAAVFHEFLNGNSMRMVSGSVADHVRRDSRDTWARLSVGFGGTAGMPALAGWLELGDRKGLGLTAGVQF